MAKHHADLTEAGHAVYCKWSQRRHRLTLRPGLGYCMLCNQTIALETEPPSEAASG